MIHAPLCFISVPNVAAACFIGTAAFGVLLVRIYLKSLGAKSAKARRHDNHSWAVPGDSK